MNNIGSALACNNKRVGTLLLLIFQVFFVRPGGNLANFARISGLDYLPVKSGHTCIGSSSHQTFVISRYTFEVFETYLLIKRSFAPFRFFHIFN